MKKSNFPVALAILCTLGIPSFIFIWNFCGQDISSNTSNWSDFGSYISAAIGLCNLIVFIIFTKEIQRYNENEAEDAKALQRPIISFFKTENLSTYKIENVGAGTALNIIVRTGYDADVKNFRTFHRCYNLKAGGISHMDWADGIKDFVAQYDDIMGNRYYSYMKDGHLTFFSSEDGEKSYKFEFQRATTPIIEIRHVQTI